MVAVSLLTIAISSFASAPLAKQEKPASPVSDFYGDPLPEGAVARLGTVKWRHGVGMTKIAFIPGMNRTASAGNHGFGVYIWDSATGLPSQKLQMADDCNSLAFSPDGKLLFTNWCQLVEVASGKIIHQFPATPTLGSPVAFSPDGKTLASARNGLKVLRSIRLFDAVAKTEA